MSWQIPKSPFYFDLPPPRIARYVLYKLWGVGYVVCGGCGHAGWPHPLHSPGSSPCRQSPTHSSLTHSLTHWLIHWLTTGSCTLLAKHLQDQDLLMLRHLTLDYLHFAWRLVTHRAGGIITLLRWPPLQPSPAPPTLVWLTLCYPVIIMTNTQWADRGVVASPISGPCSNPLISQLHILCSPAPSLMCNDWMC